MKKKIVFTRIAKFRFNNQYYQMFKARKNKIAFLKINDKGKYEFPTYNEFALLVRFFMVDHLDNLASFIDNNHKKYRFTPYIKEKIAGKTKKVMLTSLLVLSCLTGCNTHDNYSTYSYDDIYQDIVYDSSSINEAIDDENLDIETEEDDSYYNPNGFYETNDFELLESSKMITLYNNKYFKEIFGVDNYSLEEVIDTSRNNKNIPDEYRYFIEDFITTMNNYYDNLDMRVFNNNIKNLTFEILPPEAIDIAMGGAVAFYDIPNNKMVIGNDIDLVNNPKSRLIFRHELGHLFNHLKITKDGYSIKYYFNDSGTGKYLKEALNVVFTTDPFMSDYSENVLDEDGNSITNNMGYPITTNITRVLLSSMDYSLEESVSDNVYYFEDKMNEANSDDIDFSIIEELMEIQWLEYQSESIEVDEQEYVDLYGYVTRLYINNNVTDTMSYNEIFDKCNELEELLLKGVSSEDYVYINAVEAEFNNYITNHNIEQNSLSR